MFENGKFNSIEQFSATVQRTGLGQRPIPNPGAVEVDDLLPLRTEAIAKAVTYLQRERQKFAATLAPQLQERLERLKKHHIEQLELRFEDISVLQQLNSSDAREN